MEKFLEARQVAGRHLRVADHMLFVTYPLVNDPKLLVAVLENIFLSLTNGMTSLLQFDRLHRKVPPFHDTFESKFHLFQSKSIPLHSIEEKYSFLIEDVKSLILAHRRSPIEFVRHDRFYICADDFRTRSISLIELKKYLSMAKEFLDLVDIETSKHPTVVE